MGALDLTAVRATGQRGGRDLVMIRSARLARGARGSPLRNCHGSLLLLDKARERRQPGVDSIELAPDDLAATRAALAWGKPGDLLLLLTHSGRGGVLDLLERLTTRGWLPGEGVDGS